MTLRNFEEPPDGRGPLRSQSRASLSGRRVCQQEKQGVRSNTHFRPAAALSRIGA